MTRWQVTKPWFRRLFVDLASTSLVVYRVCIDFVDSVSTWLRFRCSFVILVSALLIVCRFGSDLVVCSSNKRRFRWFCPDVNRFLLLFIYRSHRVFVEISSISLIVRGIGVGFRWLLVELGVDFVDSLSNWHRCCWLFVESASPSTSKIHLRWARLGRTQGGTVCITFAWRHL